MRLACCAPRGSDMAKRKSAAETSVNNHPFGVDAKVRVSPNTFQWTCPRQGCKAKNDDGDTDCLKCGQSVTLIEP